MGLDRAGRVIIRGFCNTTGLSVQGWQVGNIPNLLSAHDHQVGCSPGNTLPLLFGPKLCLARPKTRACKCSSSGSAETPLKDEAFAILCIHNCIGSVILVVSQFEAWNCCCILCVGEFSAGCASSLLLSSSRPARGRWAEQCGTLFM